MYLSYTCMSLLLSVRRCCGYDGPVCCLLRDVTAAFVGWPRSGRSSEWIRYVFESLFSIQSLHEPPRDALAWLFCWRKKENIFSQFSLLYSVYYSFYRFCGRVCHIGKQINYFESFFTKGWFLPSFFLCSSIGNRSSQHRSTFGQRESGNSSLQELTYSFILVLVLGFLYQSAD
jgi:hypothetical protein